MNQERWIGGSKSTSPARRRGGGAHDLETGLARIKEACDEIGRDPKSVDLSMFYARSAKPEHLKAHEELGARRAIMPLPSEGPDQVLPLLDKYAELIG